MLHKNIQARHCDLFDVDGVLLALDHLQKVLKIDSIGAKLFQMEDALGILFVAVCILNAAQDELKIFD